MTKYTVLKHDEGNFLQSDEWGKVAEKVGHRAIRRDFKDGDSVLMLVKDARRGRYLEIPGGPLIDWQKPKVIREVFDEIKRNAKVEDCVLSVFVRNFLIPLKIAKSSPRLVPSLPRFIFMLKIL